MPHDIFISYSRCDLAVVKPIKEELESYGFSCWMDLDGIESGAENFKWKIVPALDRCKIVLFFISANSQKSEWTVKELDYAKRHGKRVVPLLPDRPPPAFPAGPSQTFPTTISASGFVRTAMPEANGEQSKSKAKV